MSSLKLTAAVFKSLILLLIVALATKWVRGQRDLECQSLAFEIYAFAKPSDSLDCKQACDERFVNLRKMPNDEFQGINLLSSRSHSVKTHADARGIFWIDECVAWLRYCFRQRAPMMTFDKNALNSQQSASVAPALTCLCSSFFHLKQVRKASSKDPTFCLRGKTCQRLTERLNLVYYGLWSCKQSMFVGHVSCSNAVPLCPCCSRKASQYKLSSCPDWPGLGELINESSVLGDREWVAYDLHGAPQPEEGFPLETVLEPQKLACPAEQEGSMRFKAALLPFRTFDESACARSGSCAARSAAAGVCQLQMHPDFEAIGEARERTHQFQEYLRPPQKQKKKRKAVATAEVSCSNGAFASIQQPQVDLTTHVSQFSEAFPFPFTTMDVDEPFFGPQFVFAQANIGEGHSMVSAASDIDPDNLQFSQVFAESSDLAAEHAATFIDPDNLQFSQYFSAAGSAASTESILPASKSNSVNPAKDRQDSRDIFEGVP